MKETSSILILLIVLLIVETFISTILGVVYILMADNGFYIENLKPAIKSYFVLGQMRFILYLAFSWIIFYMLNGKFRFSNKLIQLLVLNCINYILISLLYGFILIPSTKDYFIQSFFYIIIVSTIISPLILYKIPYFKRLINLTMILKSKNEDN